MIEKALCRSTTSYLKMVNGKCVDKESNTLVISFLEMSSTRSEIAVVHKNTFTFLFILGIKTVCHRMWCSLRCSFAMTT